MQLSFGNVQIDLGRRKNPKALKFSSQFYYGIREIYLDYLRLPYEYIFEGLFQDGELPHFHYNIENTNPPRKIFRKSSVWVSNNQIKNTLTNQGVRRVKSIGSKWLYLKENLKDESRGCDPRRLKRMPILEFDNYILYFPNHSNPNHADHYEPSLIKRKIMDLKQQFPNNQIVVCLYWTEFISPIWRSIAKQFDVIVVCAGVSDLAPMWSLLSIRVDFLYQIYELISKARLCIFDGYTSALIYSIDLGKNFKIQTKSIKPTLNLEDPALEWFMASLGLEYDAIYNSEIAQNLVSEILGQNQFLTREELRDYLKPKRGIKYSPTLDLLA